MMRIRHSGIDEFSGQIARKRKVLAALLSHALRLFDARQVGLVFGTDESGERFLPPPQWDRGVVDRFDGWGTEGLVFRLFGPVIMKLLRLSPVYLFERNDLGESVPADGITAYALRNHQDFYGRGIRILLAEKAAAREPDPVIFPPPGDSFLISAYDGRRFSALSDIKADVSIVARFRAKNFIAAYVPDYGAIVFNTVRAESLIDSQGRFICEAPLKSRLDHLLKAIEQASLAYLSRARGHSAVRLIVRKETRLRQTTVRLAEKEDMLREQEAHLMAVGGVSAAQLAMAPTAVYDGVFAFIDMAGSVKVSRALTPREYFFLLDFCQEIAVENARIFGCRVDNLIGDEVFFENLHIFDREAAPGPEARLMRMACLLASVLREIHDLSRGRHPRDRELKAAGLLRPHRLSLGFRAGMSIGNAVAGPIGSPKRRIFTAIGEAVDLASRLESTGVVNHIHVMPGTADMLRNAWVSKDTPMVFEFAGHVMADRPGWQSKSGFPFFEFYRTWHGLDKEFIRKKEDAACYKEFSAVNTCLIPCLPEPGLPDVCPGI